MKEFITITKALADENRVRILMALRDQELCACQIIEMLKLAPSTVSKHLSILKQAELVKMRKDGRWSYYKINTTNASLLVKSTIDWVITSTENSERANADAKILEVLLKIDREELCSR